MFSDTSFEKIPLPFFFQPFYIKKKLGEEGENRGKEETFF